MEVNEKVMQPTPSMNECMNENKLGLSDKCML